MVSRCASASVLPPQLTALRPLEDPTAVGPSRAPLGPYGPSVYDTCVLLVHCPTHHRFALCNWLPATGQHFRWFPFVHLSSSQSWHRARQRALALILARPTVHEPTAVQRTTCLGLLRLQLPRTQRFVTRVLYYVRLRPSQVDNCLAPGNTSIQSWHIQWCSVEEAASGSLANLWGAEVIHYCAKLRDHTPVVRPLVVDHSTRALLDNLCGRLARAEAEMVTGSGVSSADLERLYDSYIEHCYPSCLMAPAALQCFLAKHLLETDPSRLQSYWNAARPNRSVPHVTFADLTLCLVAIDRRTPHCEARLRVVFRFYDRDGDGNLDRAEFDALVHDLNPTATDDQILRKSNHILNRIKYELVKKGAPKPPGPEHVIRKALLGFTTFHQAVRARLVTGTSRLCRSRLLVFGAIARSLVSRRIQQTHDRRHTFTQVVQHGERHRCPTCVQRNQSQPFTLARHVVLLSEGRTVRQVNRRKVGDTKIRKKSGQSKDDTKPSAAVMDHSLEVQFNPHSLANQYLHLVRLLHRTGKKGTVGQYAGLFELVAPNGQQQLAADLERICAATESLLAREPLIVDVRSPVTVLGDIHGNLEDLLTLERSLWPSVPFMCGGVVFLGDYVDRGRWGFECALYLFCLKLLAPNKVTLLRGNHEDRVTQEAYTYRTELVHKYGPKVGGRLFELTNRCFDRLPCAAIVDQRILCVHGGIPLMVPTVDGTLRDAIGRVPRVLPCPEQSELVWQLLWSDPATGWALRDEYELATNLAYKRAKQLAATEADLQLSRLYDAGFVANRKRATAYLFGEIGFDAFAARNGLSHMVRAHEVPQDGFKLHFAANRCVTVFSCSHYCGQTNLAAVIRLADQRLRLVQIDTDRNATATPAE